MDSFFPKTRRPIANLSTPIKRPPPSITPPRARKILATPTTPKDAPIIRSKVPPPVRHKSQCTELVKRRLDINSDRCSPFGSPRSTNLNASPRKRPISVRELFKTAHLHDTDERKKEIKSDTLKTQQTTITAEPKIDTLKTQERPITAEPNEITPLATPLIKTEPISPNKVTSGPLKGVSTSLLDLIRAREAKSITPEQEKERKILGIAPEVSRIVSTVFTAFKKDILPYDKVVDKCFKGLKSNYSVPTIIECLDLLNRVAPEWVSTVDISRGRYMRINRDKYTIPQLLENIKKYKARQGIH